MLRTIKKKEQKRLLNNNQQHQNENIVDNRVGFPVVNPVIENPVNTNLAIAVVQGSARLGQIWNGEGSEEQQEERQEILAQNTAALNAVISAKQETKKLQNTLWWYQVGATLATATCFGLTCLIAVKTGVGVNKNEVQQPQTTEPNTGIHVQTSLSVKGDYPNAKSLTG